MRKRATIKDIAQHAGVSVGTVSNVLNGKGLHANDTRERVLQAAAELNFAPNALIRSLQSGKTHVIGLFMWRIDMLASRSIAMRLLDGIQSSMNESEYDILLYSRHPHEGEIVPAYFLDGRIDGLITTPGGLARDDLAILAAAGLPTVPLYMGEPDAEVGAVNIDNRAGMIAAVEYLAGIGHRRIAIISPDYTYDFSERIAGYCEGLAKAGLPIDPANILVVGHDISTALDAVERMLAIDPRPTAVLTGDDGIAFDVLAGLAAHGMRVPADISLVGFDDAPAAGQSPGITTIAQPAEEVGRTAAVFVRRLIDCEPAESCRTTLPVRLVVRGTTSPPRR